MLKGLGILAGGIFIGAVGAELVRRTWPDGPGKLYTMTGEMANAAKKAFMEGYEGALSAQERTPAEA